MTHYLVAHVKVNDNRWIPEYAANVHDIVHRHGGKYLTRSGKITALEGEAPATDLVNAFVTDPDYAPYAQARRDGTDSQLFGLDVSDVAGTIPYLTGAD